MTLGSAIDPRGQRPARASTIATEGSPCRRCGQPLELKRHKVGWQPRSDQQYWYESWLDCRAHHVFLIESEKRFRGTTPLPPGLTAEQLKVRDLIDSLISPKSSEVHQAWTRAALAKLGVAWPPAHGWRQRLIAKGVMPTPIPVEDRSTGIRRRRAARAARKATLTEVERSGGMASADAAREGEPCAPRTFTAKETFV